MKWIKVCFFYIPLVINLLNIQAFVAKFVSVSLSQMIAYLNVGLIGFGAFLLLKQNKHFPKLVQLWFLFFLCYFVFGFLAVGIHGGTPSILKSIIPVIYLFGYSILLSIPRERSTIAKIFAGAFFVSCIFLILFNYFNFSLDHEGVYEYTLSRAGGVYGDANNSAVSAILSFIFIKNVFNPKTKFQTFIKVLGLLISTYAILLTFSKTGIVVFLMVLAITYQKMFTAKRIVASILFIPVTFILLFNWGKTTDKLNEVQKERIENIGNILTLQTDKISYSERDVLFKNMLNKIYENPIIGNGVNYSVSIRGHNTIFGVWADAGIFTFILFLALLSLHFKQALFTDGNNRIFILPILITLTIFMVSLQSIINQGYLITVFVLIGYVLDSKIESEL
ncbi:O-antigen ligase family protein [Flagellimonas zhangzhouensis]|uniref:O-antigen ligase like membrane protein n=1 Tax=Flagellimonas zhangzhouensis TaxID=1073328 RepID=A0A1H2YQV8_9FLAO|nr:O-antigen ligase family protein [Allomuricauda zhangzhouensis]SDR00211.1 O-Antigen ligase [Allomuricauda zhangzhouensis]SDX07602.1 O-antigen ligase like membrane protein [Allomuricauda zhangzhouensis]